MKKGDSIKLNWKDLIISAPIEVPNGYSSAYEIAKKTGMSARGVMARLSPLRRENKIDAIQVRGKNGSLVWYYKD